MLKFIATIWAIGAAILLIFAVRDYPCQQVDRDQCFKSAVENSYFKALVWPLAIVFQEKHR